MTLRDTILDTLREVATDTDCILVDDLSDTTVLLQSGLDSLGFAMLVARLDELLGYDPFVTLQDAVYPRTLGEFIDIYQHHART